MKRFLTILKWFLIIWGGVSLIGAILIGGFIAYQFGLGNRDKVNLATKKDVRFVLNGCELGDVRIEKVVNSYVSSRSFTGDHLDAFAIKINKVTISELTKIKKPFGIHWHRGDQVTGVVDDALSYLSGQRSEIPWFPTELELRSSDYYCCLDNIYYSGREKPTSAALIFVRPSDKMVFYISEKS